MRRLIALLLIVIAGVGVYVFKRDAARENVRREMVGIVGDMSLSTKDHDAVVALVNRFHDQAFRAALDVSKELGRKFDESAYYDDIVQRITTALRDAGRDSLATAFQHKQSRFSLIVSER